MAALKFAYVRAALVDFLRANAALVTLCAHTAPAPTIGGASTEDRLPEKGCFVFARPSHSIIEEELDDGPWITSFHLLLRNTDEMSVYQMVGVIQEYVRRSLVPPHNDVSYVLHASVNLESIRWSADLSNAPEVQRDTHGVHWTDAFVVVRWREK